MIFNDFLFVLRWELMLFVIGILFLPVTLKIFPDFLDKGYIFSKVLGIAVLSYSIFVLGILHMLAFTGLNCLVILLFLFITQFTFAAIRRREFFLNSLLDIFKRKWLLFLFEEILFFLVLLFWSYVRANQPDIHGLEKYMDFGFVNSILRSTYFPPKDMWFTPMPINYYYFGHLATAVLTKISGIPSFITYNLMIASIAAFAFAEVFSIGLNLWSLFAKDKKFNTKLSNKQAIICGLLTAFLVSFGGNIQIIYSFFSGYNSANPLPFWQMIFNPSGFPNGYWYPNATRFIYHTIHEFPIYSFVVSDLHGHVLDIPFVLLTIAVLLSLFSDLKIKNFKLKIPLISFLLAIMYMTNAWDAAIYAVLSLVVFLHLAHKSKKYNLYILRYLFIILLFLLLVLPFSRNFAPFVSGIGINCAPSFLTRIGKIGPILFEPNFCQKTPLWQFVILYGFFYFWALSFFVLIFKKIKTIGNSEPDLFVLFLIITSTCLIIAPEFIYLKDIYTGYFRANTMFKLVYQAFIMLSIASGYIIVRLISRRDQAFGIPKFLFLIFAFCLLSLVFMYPYFAINSYYGNLKNYRGLNGIKYLKALYPTDYQAIEWLNKNVNGQPVILEAQGDSYTDYARVSANTGLPTVLGWTVHEWLWRGSYSIPAARIPDVKTLYETNNPRITKNLLKKYKVRYVFIGDLEYQKYPNLNENKFNKLGKVVFQSGQTRIYKITAQNSN